MRTFTPAACESGRAPRPVCVVDFHIWGLCVKTWTAFPPISSTRSITFEMPPAGGTREAPRSIEPTIADAAVRPGSHGAVADRLPPHRGSPHFPLQLALCPRPRRRMPTAHREHGHEPRGRGVREADRALAALAWDRMGRRRRPFARRHGTCQGGGAPARHGGRGVRGRRCDPHPYAGRGLDGLGRRHRGPDRGAERRARGRRPRALRRPADVQLRLAARGLGRRRSRT